MKTQVIEPTPEVEEETGIAIESVPFFTLFRVVKNTRPTTQSWPRIGIVGMRVAEVIIWVEGGMSGMGYDYAVSFEGGVSVEPLPTGTQVILTQASNYE